MKKQDDDAYSSVDYKYEMIINNPDELEYFLETSNDFDIIHFYKYVIQRLKELKSTNSKDIQIYWLVADKVRKTSAVTKYLNGVITEEDIQRHDDLEVQKTLMILKKKKEKTPFQVFKKYLKG